MLKLGGRGRTLDWVLRMKRFPPHSLLSDLITRGSLDDAVAFSLAEVVADAHAAAAVRDWDGVGIVAALETQLFTAFSSEAALFGKEKTERFCRIYGERFRLAKPLLAARAKAGAVRRCHGDLHCGNIVLIDDRPILFDAIEFSERLATCDVLYDFAFLLMDLLRLGERHAASLLLNRYFELRRGDEDLSALSLMPLFLATRAGVRAIVTSDKSKGMEGERAQAARSEAQAYFDQSSRLLTPARPRLVAIGGLSGTGKSTLGRLLCARLEPESGAIHIRSDIERKVLFGVAETERLDAQSYTQEASARVYEAIFRRAGEAPESAIRSSWMRYLQRLKSAPLPNGSLPTGMFHSGASGSMLHPRSSSRASQGAAAMLRTPPKRSSSASSPTISARSPGRGSMPRLTRKRA